MNDSSINPHNFSEKNFKLVAVMRSMISRVQQESILIRGLRPYAYCLNFIQL